MCQSVHWPVTTLPLTYAEVPSSHTEGGWLSSATSLTPSVHPGVTWMPVGKHNQEESVGAVRVRRPFYSHCFPGTAFVSPARPGLFCKQPCHSSSSPSSSSSAPKWSQAYSCCEEQEEGKIFEQQSLICSSIRLCFAPPLLGKRWGNAR